MICFNRVNVNIVCPHYGVSGLDEAQIKPARPAKQLKHSHLPCPSPHHNVHEFVRHGEDLRDGLVCEPFLYAGQAEGRFFEGGGGCPNRGGSGAGAAPVGEGQPQAKGSAKFAALSLVINACDKSAIKTHNQGRKRGGGCPDREGSDVGAAPTKGAAWRGLPLRRERRGGCPDERVGKICRDFPF